MLQAIRDKAHGWIAWAIVILISVPFALWGIQEYMGGGGEIAIAEVNGKEIKEGDLDRRTREFRDSMRGTLGDMYRPDMFDDAVLKAEVLQRMIDEFLTIQAAHDWNLRISDQQARAVILSVPAFQNNGQFENQYYEAALRSRGLSPAAFEQSLRQDLMTNQIETALRDSAFVTDQELNEALRLQLEQRDIVYVRIPAKPLAQTMVVSDAQAQDYYVRNAATYSLPERVKLAYVLLDANVLGAQVQVDDASLEAYFNENRNEFVAEDEREMRHILVAANAGADADTEGAARAKAEDLLAQLQNGADFAAIAAANSDDPGSAQNGGDLGWVSRGMMVKPFEDAGFSLAIGERSGLVRSDFGYHIIEVTAVRGGGDAQFGEMRDKVAAAYRRRDAENLFYDHAERLATGAYEAPDSLGPVAEMLGLQVQSTDWLERDSMPPAPIASPKITAAAFNDDVLTEGHNSNVIELATDRVVVLRVLEHEPQTQRPLAEVRSEVDAAARLELATEAAAAKGATVLAQLDGNAVLAGVAAENGWSLESPGPVGRQDTKVPAELLARTFSVPAPAAGKTRNIGVVSAEGDYLLASIRSGTPGSADLAGAAQVTSLGESLRNGKAQAQYKLLVADLRSRAKVVHHTQSTSN